MGQDIREFFKNENELQEQKMPEGHLERFEQKLDQNFSKNKKNNYVWMKIAAVFIMILGIAAFFIFQKPKIEDKLVNAPVEIENKENNPEEGFALSDVSPEYKKVEDFYLASINLEISQLKIDEGNKELVDSFMQQLSNLDKEYQMLNAELIEVGINEQIVNSLIENLKLRLDLLIQLKSKLNELKQEQNEKYKTQTI